MPPCAPAVPPDEFHVETTISTCPRSARFTHRPGPSDLSRAVFRPRPAKTQLALHRTHPQPTRSRPPPVPARGRTAASPQATRFRSARPSRSSRPRFFRAPPRIPTRADIDAVFRATDSDDHARDHHLVAIAAGTGLRVHKLVGLDWGQLLTEAGAVRHRVHLRGEDTTGNVGGDVVLNEAFRWNVARYRTWCARAASGLPTRLPPPSSPSPDQHALPRQGVRKAAARLRSSRHRDRRPRGRTARRCTGESNALKFATLARRSAPD